jgi:hypothetical protein
MPFSFEGVKPHIKRHLAKGGMGAAYGTAPAACLSS